MPTIELYPSAEKQPWLRVGAICYCHGEGNELFRVVTIGDNAAILVAHPSGRLQGWEPLAKLHLGEELQWPLPEQPPPPKTWSELKAEKKAKKRRRSGRG